jgi:hypothetical protein
MGGFIFYNQSIIVADWADQISIIVHSEPPKRFCLILFFMFTLMNSGFLPVDDTGITEIFGLHLPKFRIAFLSVFHSVFVIVHGVFLSVLPLQIDIEAGWYG